MANIKSLILLLLLIFGLVSRSKALQIDTTVIKQFSNQLVADLQSDNLHGCISAVVLKNGKAIWNGNFGFFSQRSEIKADTNTLYRIGSLTKTFTGFLLMELVQEKKISLDDPVAKFVPEVQTIPNYVNITIGQLATHTSGLAREPYSILKDTGRVENWERTLIFILPKVTIVNQAGVKYLYSNVGYAILGLALSRAAKLPYMQMIKEKILDPLQMKHTFFKIDNNEIQYVADGIDNSGNRTNTVTALIERERLGFRIPDGGLYTTPADLSKFISCLMLKDKLLTERSFEELFDIPTGPSHYRFGMMHSSANKQHDIVGNSGLMPGYHTTFAIFPDHNYAVIIMRNYNIGRTDLSKTAITLLRQLK